MIDHLKQLLHDWDVAISLDGGRYTVQITRLGESFTATGATLEAAVAMAWAGEARTVGPRRMLVVRFDVTGLSDAEIGALAGEVSVQAEAGDDHPNVPYPSITRA